MKVKPMPKMSKQIYVKIFISLNCGWYCLESRLAHWFKVVNSKAPVSMPLPCNKLGGFHPTNDLDSAYSDAIEWGKKPDSADAWENFLSKNGAIRIFNSIGAK